MIKHCLRSWWYILILHRINPHILADYTNNSPVVTGATDEDDDGEEFQDEHSAQGDQSGLLTPADHALNFKFYHVLKLCLKGPAHDTILHVANTTWTEAMSLLHKEYGNSTSLRKTKLIIRLFELSFDGDIDKFKQKTLSLIREIYESKVSFDLPGKRRKAGPGIQVVIIITP